jgi:hypothetical protein
VGNPVLARRAFGTDAAPLVAPPPSTVDPGSTVLVLSSAQSASARTGLFMWAAAIFTVGIIVGRVTKRSVKR